MLKRWDRCNKAALQDLYPFSPVLTSNNAHNWSTGNIWRTVFRTLYSGLFLYMIIQIRIPDQLETVVNIDLEAELTQLRLPLSAWSRVAHRGKYASARCAIKTIRFMLCGASLMLSVDHLRQYGRLYLE